MRAICSKYNVLGLHPSKYTLYIINFRTRKPKSVLHWNFSNLAEVQLPHVLLCDT